MYLALLLAGYPCCPLSPPLPGRCAVRAAVPRAARTRLRKPGSASLAAASSSLCTVGITSHKEPQQICQHAFMSMHGHEGTRQKLPLPIAAHVKSLVGLQVSHFWADLMDHG